MASRTRTGVSTMKLLELFDEGVNINWLRTDATMGRAEFTIDDTTYDFNIYNGMVWGSSLTGDQSDKRQITTWNVAFSVVDDQGEENYGNTGTGNQFLVYSTVFQAIREFIDKAGMRALSFVADDTGRQRLYARFLKKYLPDWTTEFTQKTFIALPPGYEESFKDEIA